MAGPKNCVHFNGLGQGTCKAGVAYLDIRQRDAEGDGRFACFKGEAPASTCPSCRYMTPDEVEAYEAEVDAQLKLLGDRARAGQCIHCGTPLTQKRQVGRSVYGDPCGHRQYQGRLKA